MIHHMPRQSEKPRRRERTGPKADWRHIGADVPQTMYENLIKEASKQGVPYAAVLRWALADYFAGQEASE